VIACALLVAAVLGMNHNHQHARLDDQSLSLQDNVRSVATSYFPASSVRAYGLSLQ